MNQKLRIILSPLFVFFFLFVGCTGTRPNYLGIKTDKLNNCPATPNCITSFADPSDTVHYRSPVTYKKPLVEAYKILKERLEQSPRTKIIQENSNYIYTEFTSLIMRYVDDVEFYFDEKNKLLHFRSASRLGKSDLGVNRKRIESLLKDLDI